MEFKISINNLFKEQIDLSPLQNPFQIAIPVHSSSTEVLGNRLKVVFNSTLTSWLATSLIGNWRI